MRRKQILIHPERPSQTLISTALTLGCLLLFACASRNGWIIPDTDEIQKWRRLSETVETSHTGAVILLDEGSIEFIGTGQKTGYKLLQRHRVVKIDNRRGHKYANMVIPYSSQSKVVNIRARAISPGGHVSVLQDRDIYDVSFYPNFIFYSDHRAKMFTIPGIEDGTIIECLYDIEIYNRTLHHTWNFQADELTLHSCFTLVVPSGQEVYYHMRGIDLEADIQKNPKGGNFKNTYVWEAQNVPPLKSETGMPPRKELSMRLSIAPMGFKSWKDVSQWVADLTTPMTAPGDSIKNLARRLTLNTEEPHHKLRLLFEWVRDHIRYIAVEIGVGGYTPHPAKEVFENRYGDCKDMSVLLCALCREADIRSYISLISTWHNGIPDTILPSPTPFNHAIVFCPDIGQHGLWMDATAMECPFGQLPWYDQGLPALIAQTGESTLRVTPETPPDSNRVETFWEIGLSREGEASVTGRTCYRGSPASLLRRELILASPEERREWLAVFLARRCSGTEMDEYRFSGIETLDDSLCLHYHFRTDDFAGIHSDQIILRPWTAAQFELPDLFRSHQREHPVRFRFGSQEKMVWRMKLPESYTRQTPSFSDSVSSPNGRAIWSGWLEDRTFHSSRILTLTGEDVFPGTYPEFRQFLDEVRSRDRTEFVFRRKQSTISN